MRVVSVSWHFVEQLLKLVQAARGHEGLVVAALLSWGALSDLLRLP